MGDQYERAVVGDRQESSVSESAARTSRCSAGSSRTRRGKSANKARATATRLRCPPDRRAPCRPTSVARPVGGRHPVGEPHALEHFPQLGVRGITPPDPEVLGQISVEEVVVLADQTCDRPQVVARQVVEGYAVEGDRSGFISQEPHEYGGQCRLAGAAGSHNGYPPAWWQREIDAVQRRFRRARVARPHRTGLQVVRAGGQHVRPVRAPARALRRRSPRTRARRPGVPVAGFAWRRAARPRARTPPTE